MIVEFAPFYLFISIIATIGISVLMENFDLKTKWLVVLKWIARLKNLVDVIFISLLLVGQSRFDIQLSFLSAFVMAAFFASIFTGTLYLAFALPKKNHQVPITTRYLIFMFGYTICLFLTGLSLSGG